MSPTNTDPSGTPQRPDRSWLTRRLFPDGIEPDPRFTLANERTFLAWIRTGLALLGGGIALEAFAMGIPTVVRTPAAVILVLTSLLVSGASILRWRSVELAMRRQRPLPAPVLIIVLTVGLTVATVVLLAIFVSIGRTP
jgi:putative membrane protein